MNRITIIVALVVLVMLVASMYFYFSYWEVAYSYVMLSIMALYDPESVFESHKRDPVRSYLLFFANARVFMDVYWKQILLGLLCVLGVVVLLVCQKEKH